MTKSPAGANQWKPKDGAAKDTVPDAHDASKRHAPMMFTTNLSLKVDPIYAPISKRFHENPAAFAEAFAKAWYKLTHRDMGPVSRLLGSQVPPPQLWQDPVPKVDHQLIGEQDVANLKAKILASGLSTSQLVATAWAAASSFRGTNKRGGANGRGFAWRRRRTGNATSRRSLPRCCPSWKRFKRNSTRLNPAEKVSLADLIVLGGDAAVEAAAKKAGNDVKIPFTPGRTDAAQEMTDANSFAVLEPAADGFRNYFRKGDEPRRRTRWWRRTCLLTLTAPEMTVLVGGLRVLGVNAGQSQLGFFTQRPGSLTNDFFMNLLDMGTAWRKCSQSEHVYEGSDCRTGAVKWTGTAVNLLFGSNSQLRAIAEVYG